MTSYFLKIIGFILVVFLLLTSYQIAKIVYSTKKVNLNIHPFQKFNASAKYKVLFAGDSTAVGIGASDNTLSTAGWFSRENPKAHIENYSQNGLRLKGLIEILSHLEDKRYDLAILQIGANDIINFTNLKKVDEQERTVLDMTKKIAKKVIILHSGDIGKAPLFNWPFTWIYTWRSLKVRDIYKKNQDDQVKYVDIYGLEKPDQDLRDNYAADNLGVAGSNPAPATN